MPHVDGELVSEGRCDALAELVDEGLRDSDGDGDGDRDALGVFVDERDAVLLRLPHDEALSVDAALGLDVRVPRGALAVTHSDDRLEAVTEATPDADAIRRDGEPDAVGQPALPAGEVESVREGVADPVAATAVALAHCPVLLSAGDADSMPLIVEELQGTEDILDDTDREAVLHADED